MGKIGGSPKIPQNAKNAKNAKNGEIWHFTQIPQKWDFGDCDDEHTRKA